MSDLKKVTNKRISKFADDLVIWEKGSDPEKIVKRLSSRLRRISKWLKGKDLKFSVEKTNE